MDVYCLCSGGKDSVVATHLVTRAMTLHSRRRPVVVYLDTGTGVQAQHDYVTSLCDTFGWQLWTLRTHEDYGDLVREHGFPGPGQHHKMYNRLKHRQLSTLAGRSNDAHFYTGVRKSESRARMGYVEEVAEAEGGRWTWHAPLHDWTDDDVWDYLDAHPDIPENPDWRSGGRATDCLCGAYASREELIGLEADHPEAATWLRNLEQDVDVGDERSLWGWGGMTDTETRAARATQADGQMTLCSGCAPSYPVADGSGTDDTTDT